MKYEELVNINSDTPSQELLEKFIHECDSHIAFYRKRYVETRDKSNLGNITKYSNWKRIARQKLETTNATI